MEKFRTYQIGHNKRLVILSVVIISGAYCIFSTFGGVKTHKQNALYSVDVSKPIIDQHCHEAWPTVNRTCENGS